MTLTLADWQFHLDIESTWNRTIQYSTDHCECGYCKNYYDALPVAYPEVCSFLEQFGVNFRGPSEVMPFEPTFVLACYRVTGSILQYGTQPLLAGEIPVSVEISEDDTFLLWVGEMVLPWLQQENPEDVISPANLPEFLDRMEEVWLLRHGPESIQS